MRVGNVRDMAQPESEWTQTGHQYRIGNNHNRIPEYDVRTANHLWVWQLVYLATPGIREPMLDNETLLSVMGPGCFYCAQLYSEGLQKKRCKGRA